MSEKVTREELIAEFRRLADELGKRPTLTEFNDGKYSSTPVYDRFDSYEDLKEAAGYEQGQRKLSNQELLDDIRRVAKKIGRSPPVLAYEEHGEYNFKTHKRRFGSWHDVLEEAGLEPTDHSGHWKDTEYDYEPPDGDTKVACDYCGEPTLKWEYELEDRENVYCDKYCKGAAMSNQTGSDARSWEGGKVAIECEWCGDTDKVRPSKVDSARFCCQPCMVQWRSDYYSGENHPRYKDNPKYRYYGPNWDEQAEKCRERDGYECKICSRSNEESLAKWDESLTAHHIIRFYDFDSYKVANQLPNLVTACKNCHGNLESGRVELPDDADQRFRDWVETIEKTVSDATPDMG